MILGDKFAVPLRILQWNIRSVYSNLINLQLFNNSNKFDIIVLQETWLRNTQPFTLKGYVCVRSDRNDGKIVKLLNLV